MAYPFPSSSEPFNQPHRIATLRRTFEDLPDARRPGGNSRYAMEDAALSAFSVFFMQSPSFTPWQRSRQERQGRRIAQGLFGVHPIPSDNQIRNLLDEVPPECLYPVFRYVFKGTEYFSSTQIFLGRLGVIEIFKQALW